MGRAIEMGQREQLMALKKQGLSLIAITEQLNLPFATVHNLSARYKHQGHLEVAYANCGLQSVDRDPEMQILYGRAPNDRRC